MVGKKYARVVILAIVLMFILSSNTYFYTSTDTDSKSPIHDLGVEEKPKDVAEGTKGTPIEIISGEFSIPAGKQYFVYYDNATDTLRAMKLSDLRAGLPDIALQAIDASPNWLKPNLTRKFGYLSEEDIDVGVRGNPAFADIDIDGDNDLIVGQDAGNLIYFENVDDGYHYYEGYDYFINAVYVQNDSMFSGIDVGDRSDPTFADLDSDMDVDIIVGNSTGELQYFENITTGWAAPVVLGINVLDYSTPYLVDFDGDLDYDLFVGSEDGKVNYSENVGTPFVPSWAALTNIYLDGNVSNVTDVGSFSNPAAADFFDDDGDIDLVVGERYGRLYYYSYDASTGNWTDVTSTPNLYSTSIDVLDYSSPALLDLDSNLVLDMVIGSSMGYIHYRENLGTAAEPRWLVWSNPTTGFSWVNINDYYEDDYVVKLRHRGLTSWLENYSQMIIDVSSSGDTIKQLDELVFTIAHSSSASLTLAPLGSPLVFPEVYRNNTETLYYNDQFIDYANILDFNVGTPEQWSTVEYWVNESGKINRYLHPKEIYYWFIVHPRLSDEVVTFIDPTVSTWGHWWNAASPPPTGKFWRWSVFSEASANWPADPGSVKYPKEHLPPILKDQLQGVTTMWNMMRYNAPGIYDDNGFETGNRPWNYQDHAIEKVSQWVERTLPLNAQEHNDGNRPHQPVRIQWEHNGNCGELGDLTAAALRSALIPAVEHVAYPEDHCWDHFYERWWHGMDNYWSAGGSIIDDNDRHLSWNRDWSSIMSTRGDTSVFDTSPWDHKIYDANGDGYQDRGNVTVIMRDVNGNPVDGAKIGVADWSNYGGWISIGTQWTYTNAEGIAYFHTSEARQSDNLKYARLLGGGWMNEIVDGSVPMGRYTSIALDSINNAHITYYDSLNGDLKYALGDGISWSINTIDSSGSVGQYTSLSLDSSNNPHISYYDASNRDLKYAKWTGGGWSIQIVDMSGTVGQYSSIGIDNNGNPHISYYDATNGNLKYANWTSGGWSIESIDTNENVGTYSSLDLDSSNYPHISYYDGNNTDLKYTKWNGTAWETDTLDTDGGMYTSIAIDSNNNPHISYYADDIGLKYANWTGIDWEYEIIDAMGTFTSIALDSTNYPHISYYNNLERDLKYANWTGSTWNIVTLDSFGDVGMYTSLDLDTFNKPHISYYNHTDSSRYDSGLLIHVGSKLGGGQLNPGYDNRYKICIDPPNLPVYAYAYDLLNPMPRPHPPATNTFYPGGGQYLLRASFKTLYGVQHPPNGLGLDDRRNNGGTKMFDKTYHDFAFFTGNTLDAFIVNTSNLQKYLKGEPFDANSTLFNETSGVVSFDIPLNENWHFVLSNQDTIETTKVVNLTVELFDFPTFTPDNTVQPPTNLTIALSGNDLENVTVNWDLSLDDAAIGGGEDDVVWYEIYYSRKYNSSKEGYMLLASVPNGTSSYTHAYAGNGYIGSEWEGKDYPPDNFFYFVVAKDDDWNSANTTEQVAKFIRRLAVGMNLASFPLLPIDPSTDMVLQTVAFDKVWHYNASDPDHWKTYMVFKPYKGDLLELDNKIGFWVNATEFSFLTVVGYPAQPTQIQLKAGWNLISYPSYTWSTVAAVLSTVTYERVEGFYLNAEPIRTRLYTDSDFMAPGYAYWVKASTDSVLVIFY